MLHKALIKYVLKQQLKDGTLWVSPESFEAPTAHHIKQAVIAGFLMGQPRWAECLDGVFVCGLDARGRGMQAVPLVVG